ncbi:MAG: exo-alpha-sialidase [Saprospiraceae bacterium]|nr:exo-alpha-sialidase [Saprospiraceae bacterium]
MPNSDVLSTLVDYSNELRMWQHSRPWKGSRSCAIHGLKSRPWPNNPRNSEGDFIRLKDGRLLFIYSHFYGDSPGDYGHAFLASRESSDDGQTWSQVDKIEIPNEGELNVMSVSLLRLQSGKIALFYGRKNSDSDSKKMMRISDDEAQSWGEPKLCISEVGYFVLNNDRVIQLPDGRLLLPVAQHNVPGGTWSSKGKIYCFYSDNEGDSWERSASVPIPDAITAQEPGLILLKDQSLLMYIRTDVGTQCYSRSLDQGRSWSPIEKSQLVSPLSPASIKRIPSTGDLLAVWNHNITINEKDAKQRTPLNMAISKDEGVSWQNIKELESDPDGRYCYTAIEFIDGAVLLGYASGSQSAKTHWGLTKVIKVEIPWIYQ